MRRALLIAIALSALGASGPTSTTSVAFDTRGRLAVGADDGSVIVWDVRNREAVSTVAPPKPGSAEALSFDPRDDSRLLLVQEDGSWIVDLDGEAAPLAAGDHQGEYKVDGERIVVVEDGRMRLLDSADGSTVKELGAAPGAEIVDLSWAPDSSRIVVAGDTGRVDVWCHQGKWLWNRVHEPGGVTAAASSSEGSRLVVGGPGGTLAVHSFKPLAPRQELAGHTADVLAVAFAHDGRVATASADGTVLLWDPTTWTSTALAGPTGPVPDLAFSGDGSLLAAAGPDGAHVWNTYEGTSVAVLR